MVKIGGTVIPKFKDAVEIVLEAHAQIPKLKAIGWDVTISENYKPVIMEYNLKGMGIYYYQLANGPLFGEYTEKIIQFLLKQR